MKLGIVITTFNRPEYLEQCFQSLKAAEIPEGTEILIVDDASTDKKTKQLIRDIYIPGCHIVEYSNPENKGIAYSLKQGIYDLFFVKCDVVMNLDADSIVRNDFIPVLLKLKKKFPHNIITGFNCLTRNSDGSERHAIYEEGDGWNAKRSVGGINMVFDKNLYDRYIYPALDRCIKHGGNWDHITSIFCEHEDRQMICSVPSVVQHIGLVSAMGHSGDQPDVAEDFKRLHLPNVTLIGADCVDLDRLIYAADQCMKDISFGAVKLLSSLTSKYEHAVKIRPLRSKEQYSKFMIRELADFVDTEYALTIQYDGYVLNAAGWNNEFFDYDYIGGPWWYGDKKNVGNGGFSLRSKRLLEILKTDDIIEIFHPEDHHICRTYRDYLEVKHKIKYAPDALAATFSVDGHKKHDKHWRGQFGFHGQDIIIPSEKKYINGTVKQGLVINQFFGLGDILFCMPLVMDWVRKGHTVIWPVIPEYLSIKKHFPDIIWIDKNLLEIDYEQKHETETAGLRVLPFRWADQTLKVHYRNVMRAKYDMYGTDYNRWRSLEWKRDFVSENKLFRKLGLSKSEKYNLINKRFRGDQSGVVNIRVNNGLRNIEMANVEGFTMLDWGKVIEGATEIHTVSTSLLYMIEVMKTTDKLHQYLRKPDEKNFSLTDYLWKKKWEYHF